MKGSPWLEEAARVRPEEVLNDDDSADVAIVGGGISGLATAYRLLKESDREVVLLEKELVGHGATGHNGGQVVAAFEQRFDSMVKTMGEERTVQGYVELNSAWDLLREMLRSMGGEDLLRMVSGQLGISTVEDLQSWSAELRKRRELGLPSGIVRAADDIRASPPLGDDVELTYRDVIEDLLWTRDHTYLAAVEMSVGLMNSYLFTERLAEHLLASFPERFRLFERSPVDLIRLGDEAVLRCNGRTVLTDQVVLCTNGYRPPRTEACSVPAINGRIRGVVGFMISGAQGQGVPGARSYFQGGGVNEPYFYLTRRKFQDAWLTAVGGPEEPLGGRDFDPGTIHRPGAFDRLEGFVEATLADQWGGHDRQWQGLMGYTRSGVRAVGQDPDLPALYCNLGCNGIGLLSAVAGAKRISELMNGRRLAPSMFDLDAPPMKEKRISVQGIR
jgi:glycine/D-amino acid oxidase-like deaminating enzyme